MGMCLTSERNCLRGRIGSGIVRLVGAVLEHFARWCWGVGWGTFGELLREIMINLYEFGNIGLELRDRLGAMREIKVSTKNIDTRLANQFQLLLAYKNANTIQEFTSALEVMALRW